MSRAFFLLMIAFFLTVTPPPLLAQRKADDIRYRSGNIKVRRDKQPLEDKVVTSHIIMRDGIHFGLCFDDPGYRRLPVTYYHPQGPMGLAFQKFNWFPGAVNTYHADARLPATFVAVGCASGDTCLPLAQMLAMWSEPPVGVIGMAAGTPASYARPFQHFHFYEQNKEVIALNERQEDSFFHFIPDARQRGAAIRITQGSPRQQLAKNGPRNFYHLMILEACTGEDGEKIFLDLFTKEGIAQCMEHVADDGILCVHTSHRFLSLPPILAAIGAELKLHVRVGHDQAPGNDRRSRSDLAEIEHFTSEWVLLARNERALDEVCKTPANYRELLQKASRFGDEEYWTTPVPSKQVWTDKGPNLLHGVLRGHPINMRYTAIVGPIVDFVADMLALAGVRVSTWQWTNLPRSVDAWFVQNQLRYSPRVESLWP